MAEAQHGVASTVQLYALGLSKDQVAGRVRSGWLHRVHRGVYAVARTKLSFEGALMAATLACPGAVVSHLSAARLWEIHPQAPSSIELTIFRSGGGAPRGVIVHRRWTLYPGETTERSAIPVTTPARTLLDIAPLISARELERAADEAERLYRCGIDELVETVAAHCGHRGAGALGRLVKVHAIGATVTRSDLEEVFLNLCRQHRLPRPFVNAPLHGLTVDFLWEAAKLVVEVDGGSSHNTRRGFQDDRDRDSLLAVHGYLTLRFTWFDVTRRPGVVAHRVRKVLQDRTP